MSREEFLRGLQNALSGEVPLTVVRDNLRYYDDYIRTEVQKGRAEEQVMDELGDPRLIARTIIDTTPGAGEGDFEGYRSFGSFGYGGSGDEGQTFSDSQTSSGRSGENGTFRQNMGSNIHYYDLNKWYWKLLGIVVVILIVMLVLMVIGGFLSIMIPLLPIIIAVMVVMWIVRGPNR